MSNALLLKDILPGEFRPGMNTLRSPPHTQRVLMLGDSYTYGFALAEREGIAAQLEGELNRAYQGSLYEVLNLGRPGLNLIEELALFDMLAPELEHDIVVVSLGDDDAHPWTRNELAGLGGRWQEQWHTQWQADNIVAPFVGEALQRLAKRCHASGKALMVTYFQSITSSPVPIERLRALCSDLQVPFVDLSAPFANFPRAQLIVSEVDCHPTAFAHRIAAVELAKALKALLKSDGELSWAQVEELIAFAQTADLSQTAPTGVTVQVMRRAGAARAARAHRERLRPWAAMLSGAHRQEAQGHLANLVLGRACRDLGKLHDGIFRLARERALAEQGAMVPAADLGSLCEALETMRGRLSQVREALAGLARTIRYDEAPDYPEAPERLVAALKAQSTRCRADHAVQLSQLEAGLQRLQRLLDVPVDDEQLLIRVGPESIYSHLLGNLEHWLRRFEVARPRLQASGRVRIEVQVQVPSQELLNMTLYGTFTRVHPVAGASVQYQYAVMDGQSRTYVFEAPAGAVQSFSLEVKGFKDWRGAEVLSGHDYVRSLRWVCDDQALDYDDGGLFLTPHEVGRSRG